MRPTQRQRSDMIDAAITRLVNGQAEYMAATHDGSRASLESYECDQRALKGIGLVTARDVRYSERWQSTPTDLQHTSATVDSVFIPGTVRGKVVRVTLPDGTTEYRSASSFRKKNVATRNRLHRQASQGHTLAQSECATLDVGTIGNID